MRKNISKNQLIDCLITEITEENMDQDLVIVAVPISELESIFLKLFTPEAAKVLTGPAEIALTLICSDPKLLARYLVVDSNAALATPMTL